MLRAWRDRGSHDGQPPAGMAAPGHLQPRDSTTPAGKEPAPAQSSGSNASSQPRSLRQPDLADTAADRVTVASALARAAAARAPGRGPALPVRPARPPGRRDHRRAAGHRQDAHRRGLSALRTEGERGMTCRRQPDQEGAPTTMVSHMSQHLAGGAASGTARPRHRRGRPGPGDGRRSRRATWPPGSAAMVRVAPVMSYAIALAPARRKTRTRSCTLASGRGPCARHGRLSSHGLARRK